MTPDKITKLIDTDEIIPRDLILSWMQEKDLEIRGAVYTLTSKAWYRIQPELTKEEQCYFMLHYLLDCIREDNQEPEWSHTGFDAAYEFERWLKHLGKNPEAEDIIVAAARELTATYRAGGEKLKERIVTGALEHVFEARSLRRFFAEWRAAPDLKDAYDRCVEWGDAFENAIW
ncbi:hypothetical protein [Trichlorobacter lovleyi]|mgnify:FL=1|uniref:hypothetical protein n=1 Tax=Trichlorobacter lovleyi TaxID=313985 RepID=UPI00248006F3|nr:hypothetical protein [Trichlorobacter lovleyi]